MRTTRWVSAAVSTMVMVSIAIAPSASAKGERGTVRITVPGSADVTIRKDDAAEFAYVTGLWEDKWDRPNVDGELQAVAALGAGYAMRVRFGPECPGDAVQQTIYPYAPGGPQVFTPDGAALCDGDVPSGYYPARTEAFDMLVAAGLPATASPALDETAETPAAATASGSGSGGSSAPWWIALAGLAIALGGYLVVVRARRPRTAAQPRPTV
jgi:hypothetical protein